MGSGFEFYSLCDDLVKCRLLGLLLYFSPIFFFQRVDHTILELRFAVEESYTTKGLTIRVAGLDLTTLVMKSAVLDN